MGRGTWDKGHGTVQVRRRDDAGRTRSLLQPGSGPASQASASQAPPSPPTPTPGAVFHSRHGDTTASRSRRALAANTLASAAPIWRPSDRMREPGAGRRRGWASEREAERRRAMRGQGQKSKSTQIAAVACRVFYPRSLKPLQCRPPPSAHARPPPGPASPRRSSRPQDTRLPESSPPPCHQPGPPVAMPSSAVRAPRSTGPVW